jgi:hypothetical protein
VGALLSLATALAGCGSAPIEPAYTQDELKAICERQMWWWHPNGVRGGYCEKR